MAEYFTKNIRNIVLLGHGSTGKTSLVEAMLYRKNLIDRLGKTTEGNTVCDYDPEETKRGFTLSAAMVNFVHNDVKINVIDAPGYLGFRGEAKQAARVADAAIIVVDGRTGVQVGTDLGWDYATEAGIPKAFFINRFDDGEARFAKAFNALRERYGVAVCPILIPMIGGDQVACFLNLIDMKVYTYDEAGNLSHGSKIPDEFIGTAHEYRDMLLESIAGLQLLTQGDIYYHNPKTGQVDDLRNKTPIQIRELGVRLSFVPEDRLGMGLVGNMDIVDNMMLRSYRKGKTAFLERKKPKDLADRIVEELEVVTPGTSTPVRRLSGGNVQKILVGREIAASPKVLMTAYPVRGLDINSSYTIYNLLNKQKEQGVAVIFVGEDLDVLMELCDRILVINGGQVTGVVDGRTARKEEIGLLMTKSNKKGEEQNG